MLGSMSASPSITNDPILERLDDQIIWYGRKSASHKKYFYALKVVTLVAGAAISLLPVLLLDEQFSRIVAAVLGAVIIVIESMQQLYQLQTNWIMYRSTCEGLKHEKYLFLADAGPYAAAQKPRSLLAERIESLVSQEHVKWTSVQSINQLASQSSLNSQNEEHQPAN
jgi:Protein of unknown function (DUF4231)